MRSICFPNHLTFWLGITAVLFAVSASLSTSHEFKMIASILLPFVFTYASGLYLVTAIGMKDVFLAKGYVVRIILLSLIGLISSSIVFLLTGVYHQFHLSTVLLYLAFMFLFYVLRVRAAIIEFKRITITQKMLQSVGALSCITVFTILFAFWIQSPLSFPDMTGWDVYTHMLTVRTILLDDGINEINMQYLPTIHYFYAAISTLVGIDPYYLFWASIYFVFPIAGFSLYLLGKQLSHNILVGIATAVFGITIGSSNETLGYIFPYPSTFGLIVTTFANVLILSTWKRNVTLLYLISSAIIYPFAVVANLIIIIASALNSVRGFYYYLGIGLAIIFLVVILYYGGLFLAGEGATGVPFSVIIDGLTRAYSSGQALALIFLGGFFLYYNRVLRNRSIFVITLTTIVLIAAILSGKVVAGYRLEEYTRPFIAFIISYGIVGAATEVSKLTGKRTLKKGQK